MDNLADREVEGNMVMVRWSSHLALAYCNRVKGISQHCAKLLNLNWSDLMQVWKLVKFDKLGSWSNEVCQI